MALKPLIQICSIEGCTKVSIKDVTGVYHVTDNPTGWGTPNHKPFGDAGFAVTITIDGGTPEVVTSQVPSSVTGDFTYDDISSELADGWHTILYSVTSTGEGTVTNTVKFFSTCSIKCCVEQKMIELKDIDPCKDGSRILTYMHLWSLYKTLLIEANGCNANEATATLATLQTLCGVETDCGCS